MYSCFFLVGGRGGGCDVIVSVGQPRRLSLGLCSAPTVHRSGTGVFGMLLALVRRLCTCVLFRFVQLGACLCFLWSCFWALLF